MSAYDHSAETAEATRAANILCAALTACFDWVVENPNAGFAETSVFLPIAFKKMSGPMAALLRQNSGWAAILLEVPPPLAAYVPQRTAFLVPDAFVPEWKKIVTDALQAQTQQLVEGRKEEMANVGKFQAEQEQRVAEFVRFRDEAIRRLQSLQEENTALTARVAELSSVAAASPSPSLPLPEGTATAPVLETEDA